MGCRLEVRISVEGVVNHMDVDVRVVSIQQLVTFEEGKAQQN